MDGSKRLTSSLSAMFSVLAFGLAIMMSVGVGASNLRKMDLVSRKIKASQRSGIHERVLSSTNVSLAEFYRGTDLQCVLTQQTKSRLSG